MRHEDLPGEGDRVRSPPPGPRKHQYHSTVHAPRRARACGRAGSRGIIMADGYSAIGTSARLSGRRTVESSNYAEILHHRASESPLGRLRKYSGKWDVGTPRAQG